MDPDTLAKVFRSGYPVVDRIHMKTDSKEPPKTFVQGMKQIIWPEICAQSHSRRNCNAFPNEINTLFV